MATSFVLNIETETHKLQWKQAHEDKKQTIPIVVVYMMYFKEA